MPTRWGCLRWIAQQYPELRLPILTGVSAGAINAAFLAGRPEPLPEATDLLADVWGDLSTGHILRANAVSLLRNAFKVAWSTWGAADRGSHPGYGDSWTRHRSNGLSDAP